MLTWIHTAIIITWTVPWTIVMATLAIITAYFDTEGNRVHQVARVWARLILIVSRIKVTVEGLSNIDPDKSYIYMSNHQSNFDIPVMLAYLPVQFKWLAKVELFKIPIFGRGMRGAGYISIDRSNRKSAVQSLREAAIKIQNGTSVLIFPEGTRSLDGKIRPFKKGGFVLAVESGVPVVPMAIQGSFPIMPKNRILINPGPVVLEIKEPIDTTGFTRKTRDVLLEKVRDTICETFEELEKGTAPC
ncbi:lysophospholipid acyltransferase family protein [Thermodesulfobacteriota bacterium]